MDTSISSNEEWKNAKTIFEFKVKDLDGNDVSLDKYRGYVTLIVNVASKCGLASSNYKQLKELHERYNSSGLRILAFPCNQFKNQEPLSCADLKEYKLKNEIKFDMFDKIEVNGENAHPLYKFLKKEKGGFLFDSIKWNYTKFLVDKNGVPFKRYDPLCESKSFEKDIQNLLNGKSNQ